MIIVTCSTSSYGWSSMLLLDSFNMREMSVSFLCSQCVPISFSKGSPSFQVYTKFPITPQILLDRDYCIRSNFWRFYLIRTGFTLGEPVFLVKVFTLFWLERMYNTTLMALGFRAGSLRVRFVGNVVGIARKSLGGTRNLGEPTTRQELLLLQWPWSPPHPANKSSASGMLPTGRKKMVMKLLFLSLSAYMHWSIMMLPPTHKPHYDRHQPHAACLLQSVPNRVSPLLESFTSCVVSWDDPPQSKQRVGT
jgi:hypothetical protein